MLETGAVQLAAKRDAHAASEYGYQRGSGTIYAIDATLGSTETEVDDVDKGFRVKTKALDLLMSLANFPEALELPKAGDKITTGTRTFRVRNLSGSGEWKYSDGFNKSIRIHIQETT